MRVQMFDRRTADALTVALQGDQAHALELLSSVKADILEERVSTGRAEYLLTAIVSAFVIFVGLRFASALAGVGQQSVLSIITSPDISLAAGFGALGAIFSIALGIRDRKIGPDLQRRDNLIDAALRVSIGAFSAVILFSLIKSELVGLSLNGVPLALSPQPATPPAAAASPAALLASERILHLGFLIAFLGGFSERLVGDFLERSVILTALGSATTAATAAAAVQPTNSGVEANEQNPRGRAPTRESPSGSEHQNVDEN